MTTRSLVQRSSNVIIPTKLRSPKERSLCRVGRDNVLQATSLSQHCAPPTSGRGTWHKSSGQRTWAVLKFQHGARKQENLTWQKQFQEVHKMTIFRFQTTFINVTSGTFMHLKHGLCAPASVVGRAFICLSLCVEK